jgi:hypothetical protein
MLLNKFKVDTFPVVRGHTQVVEDEVYHLEEQAFGFGSYSLTV